jgi:hypothetical protein
MKKDGFTGGQIKRCNQFVDAWVQKSIRWPKNRMNIGFVMTLQVNQLFFFFQQKHQVSTLFLQNIKILKKEDNGGTGSKKVGNKKLTHT